MSRAIAYFGGRRITGPSPLFGLIPYVQFAELQIGIASDLSW